MYRPQNFTSSPSSSCKYTNFESNLDKTYFKDYINVLNQFKNISKKHIDGCNYYIKLYDSEIQKIKKTKKREKTITRKIKCNKLQVEMNFYKISGKVNFLRKKYETLKNNKKTVRTELDCASNELNIAENELKKIEQTRKI